MVLLVNHSAPTGGIHHTEENTAINVDGCDVGTGTLYISESCVVWLNASAQGVQLAYKQISLHAISRDLSSFPHEHLLLHYEGTLPGASEMNGHVTQGTDESQSDEDEGISSSGLRDDDGTLVEIRFVPQNKESLEALFEAMSNCQTLHPDEDCQLSEEEEFEDAEENDDEFYTGEEGVANLTEEGAAIMQRLNNMLEQGQGDADLASRASQIEISNGHHNGQPPSSDTDQFQDADDMEQ